MSESEICARCNCTGCMACKNACPKQCISAVEGELGHLYPEIDRSRCIDCKLCVKVCPENKLVSLSAPLNAYAGWHINQKEYLTSTSGGAATAFGQFVINRGGVVYGCSARHGLKISHIRIDNINDLYLLKGSKYVQSDIEDSYRYVRQDLVSGNLVLFIGTPCQCAGLKSYLGKDYNNLYCVDLICHGVPSQKLLKKHLLKISEGKADYVTFRKGNDMALKVFDKSGKKIYYSNVWNERYKDSYYSTFIDGYTYRESCYQCRYAKPERCSDITVGDFWGLGSDLKFDPVNGCSCILPVTDKGIDLLKAAPLELHKRKVAEAVAGNAQLRNPMHKSFRISLFRKLYRIFGIRNAYILCELDNIVNYRLLKPIQRKLKL